VGWNARGAPMEGLRVLSATVAGTTGALGTDGRRLADYYRLEVCAYMRLRAGVQACHVTARAGPAPQRCQCRAPVTACV
jgi:hypothetical protein